MPQMKMKRDLSQKTTNPKLPIFIYYFYTNLVNPELVQKYIVVFKKLVCRRLFVYIRA